MEPKRYEEGEQRPEWTGGDERARKRAKRTKTSGMDQSTMADESECIEDGPKRLKQSTSYLRLRGRVEMESSTRAEGSKSRKADRT